MSDHIVQSDHDNDGIAGQSVHLYQSVWMAHWMHTTCKPGSESHDPLSLERRYRVDGDSKQLGPEIPPTVSSSAKGIKEFSESRRVNIMKENLKLSSARLGKERLESQSFPKFNLSQDRDGVMGLRNVTTGHGAVSETGTSSGGGHFQHEGVPGNMEQQMKSPDSLEKKSLAVSKSLQHDVGLSSKIVPYQNDVGKFPVHCFMQQQEELNQPSHFVTSKEHRTNTKFQSYAMLWVPEKKMNNPLDFRRFGTSSPRQNNMPLLLHDPSPSNDQVPVFVGKQCEDIRLNPSWSIPLGMAKSEALFHDFFSVTRIPRSLLDVETMRVCTTLDSIQELSRRPPMLSQTTHHFLVTEKNGVNLSEGGQMCRDSTFSTNLKGKLRNRFLSLSPGFGFHGQQGVKLQPLGSSTDSKGKDNLGDAGTSAVCLKNESSAETDTMDLDVLQKDNFSDVVSSPTNKITEGGQMSASKAAIASPREETGSRIPNTELPDMNDDVPALPAVTSSADDRETSTSRTQSLDVDHLLSHAELPRNSKFSALPDDQVESVPSSRWVKRLKLSASGSLGLGTKGSKMEEASSNEKVSNFFSKIMKRSMTSSEQTMGKCSNKEPMALDQNALLLRNGESSSAESVRKIQDATHFSPWIRRWCHYRGAASLSHNHEASVVCEPQSSNANLDEIRKKQFPSIAAMALVGKSLNSFKACEFRKRGTYIVWNC